MTSYEKTREWIDNNPLRAAMHRRLNSTKAKATSLGLPCDLDVDYLMTLPRTCAITGIPLVYTAGHKGDDVLSIGRIDPYKGFIRGNIHFICRAWANPKHMFTQQEVLNSARAIVEYLDRLENDEWD